MANSLIGIVESLGRPKVLVVGDLILDRYVWGDAERISQEAPVVLLRADQREERLGGSASVSMMLSALDAEVYLAGVVGADETADRTRELLSRHGVDHSLVLTDGSRPTTLKERYVGRAQQRHPQQMMRVDYEVREAISNALVDQFIRQADPILEEVDVVLISDYDKGVCTPRLLQHIIQKCRALGKKVLVDPIRGGNYKQRYYGCTTMTPNRLEAGLGSGLPITDVNSAFEAGMTLKQMLDMEASIVTLDRDGMALVDQRNERRHYPTRQRQVYDITGAGDMVLAVLGLVLAAGHDYGDAISIANIAGGLEVERFGVATVTREEIIHDLLKSSAGLSDKVVARDTLCRSLADQRRVGRTVVFTNGCFDILHAGHIQYLREAKQQGDLLVIGLNTDASVRRLGKGADRPINNEIDRSTVLSALEIVDYVTLFDESTPIELIESVRPDVLVKGADYRPEEVVGRDFVESYGGRLHLARLLAGKSTSRTLDAIRSRAA